MENAQPYKLPTLTSAKLCYFGKFANQKQPGRTSQCTSVPHRQEKTLEKCCSEQQKRQRKKHPHFILFSCNIDSTSPSAVFSFLSSASNNRTLCMFPFKLPLIIGPCCIILLRYRPLVCNHRATTFYSTSRTILNSVSVQFHSKNAHLLPTGSTPSCGGGKQDEIQCCQAF